MPPNFNLDKSFLYIYKGFFGFKSKKINLKELTFTKLAFSKFNFLDLVNFSFLDLIQSDFLDLVKFVIIDKFFIFLPISPLLILAIPFNPS